MSKMMRVDDDTLYMLKLLKSVTGSKSYQQDIAELVHEKLKETHAYTQDGYLSEGTVVEDNQGNPLVIKAIVDDKVIFTDYTYVFNGGGACWKLKKLVDDVRLHDTRVKV